MEKMTKEDMVYYILNCDGYDGIKDEKWLLRQPKKDIEIIYNNALMYKAEYESEMSFK